MIDILIEKPRKTETEYEIVCRISGTSLSKREAKHRVKTILRGYGGAFRTTARFGFQAQNFTITHDPIWDAIFPLAHWMNLLLHKGGQFCEINGEPVRFRFAFPVPKQIIDFYTRRAECFGHDVSFAADTIDYYEPRHTAGTALSFGGGKDSRVIAGMHKELGIDSTLYSADLTDDRAGLTDIEGIKISRAYSGRSVDRFMPSLMSGAAKVALGKAFGEAQRETPWQQYYEWTSPNSLADISAMLASLGREISFETPLVVLPYNLIQKILYTRYRTLYDGQASTGYNAPNEKNLQVSLLKLHHDIPYHANMDDTVFEALLRQFAEDQKDEGVFGYRNHRELIRREMRGVIHAKQDNPIIARAIPQIPDSWAAPWIDYVHSNVWPDIPKPYLDIFSEYAPDISDFTGDIPVKHIG